MATIEEENAALEARIAQLEQTMGAAPTPSPANGSPAIDSSYGVGQLMFDVPMGITRGVLGAADLVAYPFIKGLQYAGADIQPWGGEKFLKLGAPLLAEKLGVRPSTEVQRAVEFMTPVAPSKTKVATELGLGLASYLGMRGAESIDPESAILPYVGAVAAPLGVQATGALTKAALQSAVPTAKILAGSEDALKAAAQEEIMTRIGQEGTQKLASALGAAEAPAAIYGTGGVPLTLAELVQTPAAAQLQQSLLNTPEGARILAPAVEKRASELTDVIGAMGIAPQQGEMSLLIKDAAKEAADAKALKDSQLAEALGLSPLAEKLTKTETGDLLQQSLLAREDVAYTPVRETWSQVNKKAQLDVAPQLVEALNQFNQFGDLTKKRISSVANDAIKTVEDIIYKKDGLITVGEYQDLRATANAALRIADKATDPEEISLMRRLKNNLDSIDETAVIKEGTGEDIGSLFDAIEATKNYKQTFAQGVTGELLGKRGGELKLKASQVIDRVLKYPENISEIFGKFGKSSDEAIILRNELLTRLNTARNPTEFLGQNKDLFKRAFEDDYTNVAKFAQAKGQKAPLDEFTKITDSTIPSKIFSDEKAAGAFAKQFEGTPVLEMGKSKFIADRLMRGSPVANLNKNRAIAAQLFKDDLPKLENILTDLELSKLPANLERQLASGNSITSVRSTSLGAMFQTKNILESLARKGEVTGLGLGIATGPLGTILGYMGGQYASKLAKTRLSAINAFQAEMLSNPQLLRFAEAPPTKENIDNLMSIATRLGVFAGKTATTEDETKLETPATSTSSIDEENMVLEQRIQELEQQVTGGESSESVTVGKQNISIPQGEGYAPPNVVKAIMQIESSGNPKAVSEKGAAGLMQLMPGTARDLGVEDRFDPQQNIEGGSRYIAQQIERFGSLELALAAYNWGPENIKRAVATLKSEGKPITWDNIVATVKVPKETRNYVNKVISLI